MSEWGVVIKCSQSNAPTQSPSHPVTESPNLLPPSPGFAHDESIPPIDIPATFGEARAQVLRSSNLPSKKPARKRCASSQFKYCRPFFHGTHYAKMIYVANGTRERKFDRWGISVSRGGKWWNLRTFLNHHIVPEFPAAFPVLNAGWHHAQ